MIKVKIKQKQKKIYFIMYVKIFSQIKNIYFLNLKLIIKTKVIIKGKNERFLNAFNMIKFDNTFKIYVLYKYLVIILNNYE